MRNVVHKLLFVLTCFCINPSNAQSGDPPSGVCNNGCNPSDPNNELTVDWINDNFDNTTTGSVIASNPAGQFGTWIRYAVTSQIYWYLPNSSGGDGGSGGSGNGSGGGSSGGGNNGGGGDPLGPGGGSGNSGGGSSCPGGVMVNNCVGDSCTATCQPF